MALQSIQGDLDLNQNVTLYSRRKHRRFDAPGTLTWDFFSATQGTKTGYLVNISKGGCLIRTCDLIEHRRWIRLAIKGNKNNLWFTAVGRVIRRQERLEPWGNVDVTLYRFGVQFVQPVNPIFIESIETSQASCSICGTSPAIICNTRQPTQTYCVRCHLRLASNTINLF